MKEDDEKIHIMLKGETHCEGDGSDDSMTPRAGSGEVRPSWGLVDVDCPYVTFYLHNHTTH